MNATTRSSIIAAAALAATLPSASAFGANAGNFVWNGGFEESYIYWANGIGNSNPYSLRYSEYGDINGIEARLEHWTGTGGIADKDASTAPRLFVDPAAGWATTFRADATWTDPSTGDKYTCTGLKLYRNGALINEKASLDCPYVHPDGVADDRIVWGWKPWAPGGKMLRGAGTVVIIR